MRRDPLGMQQRHGRVSGSSTALNLFWAAISMATRVMCADIPHDGVFDVPPNHGLMLDDDAVNVNVRCSSPANSVYSVGQPACSRTWRHLRRRRRRGRRQRCATLATAGQQVVRALLVVSYPASIDCAPRHRHHADRCTMMSMCVTRGLKGKIRCPADSKRTIH